MKNRSGAATTSLMTADAGAAKSAKLKKKKAAIFKTKDEQSRGRAARRKAEAQKREDDARRAVALRSVETAAFGGGASNPSSRSARHKKPAKGGRLHSGAEGEAPLAPTSRAPGPHGDEKADGLASSILEKPSRHLVRMTRLH